MAGVIESIKKIYSGENAKKTHLILFAICFVYMLCSTLFDIAIGKPDNMRQNPFDFVFGLFIGMYSIQYLHNALHNIRSGELPFINEINKRIFLPMIGMNIVWGFYLVLAIIIGLILYITTKSIILTSIYIIALSAIAFLAQFLTIALSENFELKGLLNIMLIFRFTKAAFFKFWGKALKVTGLVLVIVAAYILLYVIGEFTGISHILALGKDYYLFDIITLPVFMYCFVILLYFVLPYSLIDTYNEKIRPILGYEDIEILEGDNN